MDRKRITVLHMACQITRPNTICFFLWGFVKDYVHWTPVRDLSDLQERIYTAVSNVTPQMLHNTWVEVEYRLEIFRATNGSRIEVYGT